MNEDRLRRIALGRWLSVVVVAGTLLASAALTSLALAQAQKPWPARPITLIIPYPPGGSNDTFARTVSKRLGEVLGQPIVVENRPGAGGSLGTSLAAQAPADGYTFVAVSSSFLTNAAVQTNLPYDPIRDLVPVALIAKGPFLVAVSNALPVTTPAELIALGKAQPDRLNYASSGPGSSNQFAAELLKLSAGISMVHVPYRGMGPATADLMANSVQVLVASGPSLMPAIRANKARAIAVTSANRSAIAPDLPTMASVVPGYVFEIWWGLLAPAGTPAEIVDRVNREVGRIVTSKEMADFFIQEGAEGTAITPQAYAQLVREELDHWKRVARESGIKAE
jgi:tripartite-type tricarboxylate transporter receptor subunit TctC